VKAALVAGDNGPEAMAEIYRLTGVVSGALDDPNAATVAFQQMLALSPKATLPAGTSPKIANPFASAQSLFETKKPLAIEVDTTANPPTVVVRIVSDPLAMIVRVVVFARVDGRPDQKLERRAAAEVKIAVPLGRRIDVRVAALDEHGNRLGEIGTVDVPVVIVGGASTDDKPPPEEKPIPDGPPAPASPRPLYAKWWLWGGIAIGFAGGAGYFAYATRSAMNDLDRLNANSSQHTFDEAREIEDRAKLNLLLFDIGVGVAGAAAIVATLLYLTEPDHRPSERRATIRPAAARGVGGVVVEVPF
jgi:hypothetical protein